MDWIKRNLFFVIGASVALILMIGAGFYTWTGYRHNSEAGDTITGKYAELNRLINLNPNPGSDKVDNIKRAVEQQKQLRTVITNAAARFDPIPAIPPETNVTAETFASGLSTTIHRLQVEATNAGVILQPRYNFSFEQQSKAVKFSGTLGPLAVQLGEVSEIVKVLIAAKINSLENIQRERVSQDDSSGAATDYVELHAETNELAILAPYQVTFRCFTPELSQVLCGFASNPHGLMIKSLNVEPSTAQYTADVAAAAPVTPMYVPVQPQPTYRPPPRGGEDGEMMRRYGITRPTPQPQPQVVYAQPSAASSGPRTVLDEKQLKVTLLIQVVKLLHKN